jgi:hypothetical protein
MSEQKDNALKPPPCKACKQRVMLFQWSPQGYQYFWVCPNCNFSMTTSVDEVKQFAPKKK